MSTNYPGPDQSGQHGGYTGYSPSSGSQQGDQNYQYGQNDTSGQDYQYGQYSPPPAAGGQQQQQQMYQPPARAQQRQDPSSISLKERRSALYSYVLGPITGLIFFVIGRKSRFVRFSAAQSFVFFGVLTVVYIVLQLIKAIPVVGTVLLAPIIGPITTVLLIVGAVVWVFLMFMANRGNKIKLPFFGGYAERIVERFTKKQA